MLSKHLELSPELARRLRAHWIALPEDDEEGFGARTRSPRPAPFHIFADAAMQLDSSIPAWLPAFWSCHVRAMGFGDVARVDIADRIVASTKLAHEWGVEPSLCCFAALHEDRPGTLLAFERAPRHQPNPSDILELYPRGKDPAERVRVSTPIEYLRALELLDLIASDGEPPPSYADAEPLRIEWEYATRSRLVEHPKFGRGHIIARHGQGSDEKLEIEFERVGKKTLLARFVVS